MGAKILDIVAQATTKQRVAIKLDLAFANNCLHCEWAYVVGLDNEVLEVYMGTVSKGQAVSERFNSVGEKDDAVLALVKSFPFAQLTTEADFLVALKEDLGEEVTEVCPSRRLYQESMYDLVLLPSRIAGTTPPPLLACLDRYKGCLSC